MKKHFPNTELLNESSLIRVGTHKKFALYYYPE